MAYGEEGVLMIKISLSIYMYIEHNVKEGHVNLTLCQVKKVLDCFLTSIVVIRLI